MKEYMSRHGKFFANSQKHLSLHRFTPTKTLVESDYMSVWEFMQQNSFLVGAVTGSLATFILGEIVKYYRREKKTLGYSISSRKIIERGDRDIEIRYKNQEINNIFSNQVTIRNIGNRALKDLPIKIGCDNGKILENELSSPEGANYTISNQDNDKSIIINCDLINKGESFHFGFTSINVESEKISVIARGENLTLKEISQDPKLKEILEVISNQTTPAGMLLNLIRYYW